jgi:hypothetical protein
MTEPTQKLIMSRAQNRGRWLPPPIVMTASRFSSDMQLMQRTLAALGCLIVSACYLKLLKFKFQMFVYE